MIDLGVPYFTNNTCCGTNTLYGLYLFGNRNGYRPYPIRRTGIDKSQRNTKNNIIL
ncbi:hypothetical protein [Pectinatus cerevisiiphilus]|uniref:hypothetical protein n=1 Tax=Pectinatus cerevisiiphilus TaxID=86956 RepID=UPI001E416FFC|nr:hypothetical protein [Pectinatus cerevisiiphilus]